MAGVALLVTLARALYPFLLGITLGLVLLIAEKLNDRINTFRAPANHKGRQGTIDKAVCGMAQ